MYEVTATIFITVKKRFVRPIVEHAEVVRQSNATSVERKKTSLRQLAPCSFFEQLPHSGSFKTMERGACFCQMV